MQTKKKWKEQQWRCMCGRRLRKMKCLRCGDRFPRWVEEGKITLELRRRMDTQAYRRWHEDALTDIAVANALKDVKTWVRPRVKKGN